MSAIWEELVFLDKETGEALQRFVYDKPYSFLFACADTNELYTKFDRILIKDQHAPEKDQEGDEAEEGKREKHEDVAGPDDSGQCAGGRRAWRSGRRRRSGRRGRRRCVSERPSRLWDYLCASADGVWAAIPATVNGIRAAKPSRSAFFAGPATERT